MFRTLENAKYPKLKCVLLVVADSPPEYGNFGYELLKEGVKNEIEV